MQGYVVPQVTCVGRLFTGHIKLALGFLPIQGCSSPLACTPQVTFLNITGFRDCPLADMPMLEVLRQASERVFVPLTVGGGIRGFSSNGRDYSALEVASEYFRSGADKISIGSDAVEVAEQYIATGGWQGAGKEVESCSRQCGWEAGRVFSRQ